MPETDERIAALIENPTDATPSKVYRLAREVMNNRQANANAEA